MIALIFKSHTKIKLASTINNSHYLLSIDGEIRKISLIGNNFIIFSCSPTRKFQEAAKSWEPEIQKLEAKDKVEKDPENAILYIGSSSIRLWKNIDKEMSF